MKTITRSNMYLPMAAIILTAAFAVTAAGQKQVPFKGTLQGNDSDSDFNGTTVVVTTIGKGIGAQVGQFSFKQIVTLNITNGTTTGSAHWIAANGDSIDTTIIGS